MMDAIFKNASGDNEGGEHEAISEIPVGTETKEGKRYGVAPQRHLL
jgi:hypothetical protein